MAGERFGRGIGRAIVVPATVMLVALMATLGTAVALRLSGELERTELTRAQISADALSASADLSMAVSPGDTESMMSATKILADAFARDPYMVYALVVGPKGVVLSRYRSEQEQRVLDARAVLGLHEHLGRGEAKVIEFRGEPLAIASSSIAFSGLTGPDERPPPSGTPIGRLHLALSTRAELGARARLIEGMVAVGGAAVLLYVLVMTAIVRRISRRVRRVVEQARAVEQGDLTARVGDATLDELGLVARAFDDAAARFGRIVAELGEVARGLETTTGHIATVADSVRAGAHEQRAESERSASVTDDVAGALADIARRAESVVVEARAGAVATARISDAVDGLAGSIDEAQRAVDGTATGVGAMSASLGEMARRAAEVSSAVDGTAGAMGELDATIRRVRESAVGAAQLAESAGGDAERGQQALRETVDGIERIRENALEVKAVTLALEGRAREVRQVLTLVGELTDRTNLLALNASIIAAHAGANGRGFAVVAGEIKELANRTSSSASSIEALVGAIEEDSAHARNVAEAGAATVEEGAARAQATAQLLNEIFQRSGRSAELSLSIASATDEQVLVAGRVVEAMRATTRSVGEIARLTGEHEREGARVVSLVERLHALIRSIAAALHQQREGARAVAGSVHALRTTLEEVTATQRSRADDGNKLRRAFGAIRAAAAGHETAVAELDRAITSLETGAGALTAELQRLQT